jgi:hypothetical protein
MQSVLVAVAAFCCVILFLHQRIEPAPYTSSNSLNFGMEVECITQKHILTPTPTPTPTHIHTHTLALTLIFESWIGGGMFYTNTQTRIFTPTHTLALALTLTLTLALAQSRLQEHHGRHQHV